MTEFNINRGIGKPVEFKGLRSQYLFLFVGGLLGIFILFVVMYTIGINQWICIAFGAVAAAILVTVVFRLNKKYGPYGLMKLTAVRYHPHYIINRLRLLRLFKKGSNEKYIKNGDNGE